MLYVMTGSFTTGAWYYRGLLEEGAFASIQGQRCETPTGFARFQGDTDYTGGPPRSYRRARLQPDLLERAAARRPFRRHGGAGPLRRGRARLGQDHRRRRMSNARYDFASDNVVGAMPEVMAALAEANAGAVSSLRRRRMSARAPPT